MNIAIIIGISKYINTGNDLPGSKKDAEVIYNILTKTNKYEHTLYINQDEPSAKLKEMLVNFISKYKGTDVDELFFYYSGHGGFMDNQFLYLLSDYDSKKRNQTSLQNDEVDDLIRTLCPKLVIKLIDACNSGVSYIKEIDVLEKYFNESKRGFDKCYFINSSLNNQPSYQDINMSYFTLSFVKALNNHIANEIRYKDIIDVISDDFTGNPDQTPFFVTQADFTEKFCQLTEDLKSYLQTLDRFYITPSQSDTKTISIKEMVMTDAKNYIEKKDVLALLEEIRQKYITFNFGNYIDDLYEHNISFINDYQSLSRIRSIVNWLNKNPEEYFATPIYDDAYDEDGNLYEIVNDIEIKIDIPYKYISIEHKNKYPNIFGYNSQILFLLSRKSIRFFYHITNYQEDSWDENRLNLRDVKWVTIEASITNNDSVMTALKSINNSFKNRIEKDIKDRLNISDSKEQQGK